MGRYKKILVAVDGSESSMHALKESFKLANSEKSWITVVSVMPSYEGDLDLVSVRNVTESMKKPFEDALSDAKKIANEKGALIKTVVEEGEVCERIIDLSDAENSDLIIMGRRGLRRIERVLVGSVTARVIGFTQKDVLVVPKDAEIGLKKILLATDGSKYSEAAAERAIDLAKTYEGELKVISVVEAPSEVYEDSSRVTENLIKKAKGYTEDVAKRAESAGIKAEAFVKTGKTCQVITEFAKEQKSDLIIMGSHGKRGLRRLLMGSVAERVIGLAACPVLVVKT
jgi:nucleotide-binding universal stress UspA family protein